MKLLLDTHTFLWWDSQPEKLSKKIFDLCQNENNILYLSIVSLWEIQIKVQLKKLELRLPLQQIFDDQCARNKVVLLDISPQHIFLLADLSSHHKDPFDRLLIAQAKTENMLLLSKDHIFQDYDINVIW